MAEIRLNNKRKTRVRSARAYLNQTSNINSIPDFDASPTATPSVTPTPSTSPAPPTATPSVSVTPTVTRTPSVTPTISPSPAYFYLSNVYNCVTSAGQLICGNFIGQTVIYNGTADFTLGYYYIISGSVTGSVYQPINRVSSATSYINVSAINYITCNSACVAANPSPSPTPSSTPGYFTFTMKFSNVNANDACDNGVLGTYYGNNSSLVNGSQLYTNTSLTTSASDGYYCLTGSYSCPNPIGISVVEVFEGDIIDIIICPSPSPTPSVTPSVTPTISVTPSITPTISETPSVTPSETPSVSITPTISETPSITPSETPSETPSITPSETPSVTPSETPSVTPTISETPSITPSETPTPSPSI